MIRARALPTALAALALCACGGTAPDAGRRGADADPALAAALHDPILTDPALTQQANATAVRPAGGPVLAQYPPGADPSDLSAAEALACGAAFQGGAHWEEKLPAAFAAAPGERTIEAAGVEAGGCRRIVVARAGAEPPERAVERYRDAAVRAGWSAARSVRGGAQVLAGAKQGATFYLVAAPRGAGAETSLIVVQGG